MLHDHANAFVWIPDPPATAMADRTAGDLQLIRLVRNYAYLYDTTSENYKNVKLKDNTWNKISSNVGLPVEVTKTRWKSLRTSYLRHCKLIASRKKESSKYRKWALADELKFLNPFLVPNECIIAALEEEGVSQEPWSVGNGGGGASGGGGGDQGAPPDDDDALELDDDVIEEVLQKPSVEEIKEAMADSNDPGAESEVSYSSAAAEPDSGGRRGGGGGGGRLSQAATTPPPPPTTPVPEPPRRDTVTDFFLYLAETVKTFPPFLQAQVKAKCFEAVNTAELSLMEPSPFSAASPRGLQR